MPAITTTFQTAVPAKLVVQPEWGKVRDATPADLRQMGYVSLDDAREWIGEFIAEVVTGDRGADLSEEDHGLGKALHHGATGFGYGSSGSDVDTMLHLLAEFDDDDAGPMIERLRKAILGDG